MRVRTLLFPLLLIAFAVGIVAYIQHTQAPRAIVIHGIIVKTGDWKSLPVIRESSGRELVILNSAEIVFYEGEAVMLEGEYFTTRGIDAIRVPPSKIKPIENPNVPPESPGPAIRQGYGIDMSPTLCFKVNRKITN